MNIELGTPAKANPWMEFPDAYWRAYFGKNADYYMRQLGRLQQGSRPDFLWEAFFFGFIWILYRKMYLVALCTFLLLLAESTIEEGLLWFFDLSELTGKGISSVMSIAIGVAVGTFANRVYFWHARRAIQGVLSHGSVHVEEIVIERLRKSGGTSWYFLLILLALFVLIVLLANLMDLASSLPL